MRVLVIDNYDSFTWNLIHLLRSLGAETVVARNDAIDLEQVAACEPDRVVVSPGPGGPSQAGVSADVVRWAAGRLPVLGVCLGHQVIAGAYGGRITRTEPVVHGRTSRIGHTGDGIFEGLPQGFDAMRYHSLGIRRGDVAPELTVSAWLLDDPDQVMGVRHREHDVEGVQFHPESFMTPEGRRLVRTWLAGRPVLGTC